MPQEILAPAIRFFFETALPRATGKSLSQLGADAKVRLGAYRAAAGSVSAFGVTVQTQFALFVNGDDLPRQGEVPDLGSATVSASAAARRLTWLRHVADVALDTKQTIQECIQDLDSFDQGAGTSTGTGTGTGTGAPTGTGTGASASAWATAIEGLGGGRSALAAQLSSIATVPAGLASLAPTPEALRSTLAHFFTYDASGNYYAKWAASGQRRFPDDLTPAYKQANFVEHKLERDQCFLYARVPQSLFTGGTGTTGPYREVVFRFSPGGPNGEAFNVAVVHTVGAVRAPSDPAYLFVPFYAEAGLGLALPPAALRTMSADVALFVHDLPADPAAREAYIRATPYANVGPTMLMPLQALVDGEPTWPADVIASGTGAVRQLFAPADKLIDVATTAHVVQLRFQPSLYQPKLDQAKLKVELQQLRDAQPVGKKDGEGVLVGIIDSGIDGRLAAAGETFDGRLIAVWEQDNITGNPTATAPQANSPAGNHPGDASYAAYFFGTEYTGASVVNARDGHASVNHGTHVASIAAGAEVRDGAGNVLLHAGMAPKAKIAVVRGGSLGLAIRYLFKKASELGANVPCVINMSFGSHDNAHDGSDEDARVVAAEMKDSAGNYRPGRILVAAAGNERNKDIHVRKRFGFGIQTLRYQTNKDQDTGVRSEPVTIWVRNEGSGAPIYGIRVSNPTTAAQSSSWYFSTSANNTHNVPGRPLRIRVRFSPQDPANGDYNARVEFQTTDGSALVREEWQIQVLNFMASQIDVHAWSAWETGKFLGLAPDDASFLVCSPATSRDVISVASMNSRLNWTDIDGTAQNFGQTALGDISSYSSPGPCRTATNNVLNLFGLRLDLSPDAVDIAAPGSAIAAARGTDVLLTAPPGASTQVQQWVAGNRRRSVSTKAQMLQGTSMATPVVTGIIANILAEEPNLTQADVTRRLQESVAVSERPSTTAFDAPGNVDREDWGVARGYLRAHKLRRPGP